MRHVALGRSGLTVGVVGLGTLTWGRRTPAEEARAMLGRFLSAGGDLVDTAHGYGDGEAETILGALLDEVGRDNVTVVTKAGVVRGPSGSVVDTSRRTLMRQLDTSLSRLRTHHVDVWLVNAWSARTPLEETLSALEWAWRSGRARYVGVSNYSGWQLARAVSLAERLGMPLVCDEVEYSLLDRGAEHEVLPAAEALGAGVLAWSPLGRGVLTGKYATSTPSDSRGASTDFAGFVQARLGEQSAQVVGAVTTAARGLRLTPATLSLAWVLSRPAVSAAVVGPRNERQLANLLEGVDTTVPAEIAAVLDEVSASSL